MSKAVLDYCGQQPCRETITTLLAQRAKLLAAAKAALPLIGKQPAWDWMVVEKNLREAIKEAEEGL